MSSDTRSSTLWLPNHAEMFRASMPVSSTGAACDPDVSLVPAADRVGATTRRRRRRGEHRRRWRRRRRCRARRRARRPLRRDGAPANLPRRPPAIGDSADRSCRQVRSRASSAGGARDVARQRVERPSGTHRPGPSGTDDPEVGDARYDEDRPRLVGAVDHRREVGDEPRPVEVAVDRIDLSTRSRSRWRRAAGRRRRRRVCGSPPTSCTTEAPGNDASSRRRTGCGSTGRGTGRDGRAVVNVVCSHSRLGSSRATSPEVARPTSSSGGRNTTQAWA